MTGNPLLQAFRFPCGAELKNRLLMAPMTTCSGFYDGTVSNELVDYYRARAGALGAIIVESCFIDNSGPAFPGAIGVDSDGKIGGLARLAAAIKDKGSKAILQIYHGGRMVSPALIGGRVPVAPSAIAAPREGAPVPAALSAGQVQDMVAKFGDAVRRAVKAGFDGVELHGANTYLIQQFYSPNSNRRSDKWGGSVDKRAAFPLAVLDIARQAARSFADDNFIIGYRFSPEEIEEPGICFADSLHLLEKMAESGLDYVHFSMGHILRPSLVDKEDSTPLIRKFIRERGAHLVKIPVIGVGGVVNRGDAETALAAGYDLVAVGKACIAYPDWAERISAQEESGAPDHKEAGAPAQPEQKETKREAAAGESNIKAAPAALPPAEQARLELYIDSTRREELLIPEPLWRFSLVEAMIRDMSVENARFHAGTYQEDLSDDGLRIVMNVTLETDRIKDITLASGADIDEAFAACFNTVRSRILEANSPHIDAVAGATAQSEAVKQAVFKALMKSSREALSENGGEAVLQRYDVVIAGAGGAGLAAAIEARDNGAKVLIVEKMPVVGGNTIKASAGMNAAETRFQREKNIVDHKAQFFQETMSGGHHKNNPSLLWYFVEHAPEAVEWLDRHGITLSDITTTGGMGVDRTHRPADRSAVGGYLVSGLLKNVHQRHIDIMTDTAVSEILRENGKVAGVRLRDSEGEEQIILTKGVIIATGGFSANSRMVEKYRPELKGFVTTNHAGATGDGITLLQRLGADTVDMKEIQIHPTVEQSSSYLISESVRGGGAVLVSQAGRRFCNEMETRDKVSGAIIALPEHYAYIIFDEQVKLANKAVEQYISRNLTIEAATIADLAARLKMNADNLAATLQNYNMAVAAGADKEFGRVTALRRPIAVAPFYAVRIAPGIHHTMGGVKIDQDTAVLDKEGDIIEGVWAAGEVAGGVHGGNRIGGNAVADIIIFGITAGRQAAAHKFKR